MKADPTPDYAEYVRLQTRVHGQIVKPRQYHLAERRAIDWIFNRAGIPRQALVLDAGCGIGLGLHYIHTVWGNRVVGLELNPEKVAVARFFGYTVFHADMMEPEVVRSWAVPDFIYCSHALEHTSRPEDAVRALGSLATHDAGFFFILPFPDTGPPDVHCGSEEIGSRGEDPQVVCDFFEGCGLRVRGFDLRQEREPEIWVWAEKR